MIHVIQNHEQVSINELIRQMQ